MIDLRDLCHMLACDGAAGFADALRTPKEEISAAHALYPACVNVLLHAVGNDDRLTDLYVYRAVVSYGDKVAEACTVKMSTVEDFVARCKQLGILPTQAFADLNLTVLRSSVLYRKLRRGLRDTEARRVLRVRDRLAELRAGDEASRKYADALERFDISELLRIVSTNKQMIEVAELTADLADARPSYFPTSGKNR